MGRLKVFYQNQLLQEIDLSLKPQWLFGRDASCDVVLDQDPAISRRHFEIVKVDGDRYKVNRITQNPLLFLDGQPVDGIFLDRSLSFEIPSYRFEFQPASSAADVSESETVEEKTSFGLIPYVAYLVLLNQQGLVRERYNLVGNRVVIGRDPQCDVVIDDSRLSRQHFAILRQIEGYFIVDLNSSNGTYLNEQLLEPNVQIPLKADDEIRVLDLRFRFELVDASFEARVVDLVPVLPPDLSQGSISTGENFPKTETSESSKTATQATTSRKWELKVNRRNLRLLFLGLIALGSIILVFFMQTKVSTPPLKEPTEAKTDDPTNPFDKLSPDQKLLVEQLYKNAQNYMQLGKYELAKQELTKLHDMVPFYQDSRQLEEACNQAITLLQEKEKLEAEAREQERIQRLVQDKIQECRKLLNPNFTRAQMEDCLAEALSYDPNNAEMKKLIEQASRFEQEKRYQIEQEKMRQAQTLELEEMYQKAYEKEKKGLYLDAIAAYREVEVSELFDSKGIKRRAKRQREGIEHFLKERQHNLQERAFELYRRKRLKEAIELIREALVINPKNQILVGIHEEWMDELRKSLMSIYQEAAFEESIGEVDSAIQKWQYIQRNSLPGEDYYEKSRVKLRRYGVL